MMAAPYTTPWMPGSMLPSSAFSDSANGTSIAAPITGPQIDATPPNNVTTTGCADTSSPKTESGVTTSSTQAYRPPAAAAIAPDVTSARIFHCRALIPAASAASSFCRIASSARPKREFSTSTQTTTPAASSPIATTV